MIVKLWYNGYGWETGGGAYLCPYWVAQLFPKSAAMSGDITIDVRHEFFPGSRKLEWLPGKSAGRFTVRGNSHTVYLDYFLVRVIDAFIGSADGGTIYFKEKK